MVYVLPYYQLLFELINNIAETLNLETLLHAILGLQPTVLINKIKPKVSVEIYLAFQTK